MGVQSRLTPEAGARFVLGLQPGCTDDDVKRAYRRLALIFHPDKNLGSDAEEAKKKFQAVVRAKECLLGSRLVQSGARSTESPTKSTYRNGAAGAACPGSRKQAGGSVPPKTSPTEPKEAREAAAEARPSATTPTMFAAWVCGACEMRDLGSSPGGAASSLPCCRAKPSTRCFCGHSLEAHAPSRGNILGGKLRCMQIGCLCGQFSYVPPGARCTCGHSSSEHDAVPFHACEVLGCSCATFHCASTCACGHNWACHRTEIRNRGFAEPAPRAPAAAAEAEASDASSSSVDSPPPPPPPFGGVPPRRRPASANSAGRRFYPDVGPPPPNKPPPTPPMGTPGQPAGCGSGADGRPQRQRPSSAHARSGYAAAPSAPAAPVPSAPSRTPTTASRPRSSSMPRTCEATSGGQIPGAMPRARSQNHAGGVGGHAAPAPQASAQDDAGNAADTVRSPPPATSNPDPRPPTSSHPPQRRRPCSAPPFRATPTNAAFTFTENPAATAAGSTPMEKPEAARANPTTHVSESANHSSAPPTVTQQPSNTRGTPSINRTSASSSSVPPWPSKHWGSGGDSAASTGGACEPPEQRAEPKAPPKRQESRGFDPARREQQPHGRPPSASRTCRRPSMPKTRPASAGGNPPSQGASEQAADIASSSSATSVGKGLPSNAQRAASGKPTCPARHRGSVGVPRNRRSSTGSTPLRGASSVAGAAAAAAAAAAACDGRPWWERLHMCGKVRPHMPFSRESAGQAVHQPPGVPARAASATSGVPAPSQQAKASAASSDPADFSQPATGNTGTHSEVDPMVTRQGAAGRMQRTSSLREDSFIVNDDGAAYFGADSDEDCEAFGSGAGCPQSRSFANVVPASSKAAPSRLNGGSRRPRSAPSSSSSATSAHDDWARETLRRLRLQKAEHNMTPGGISNQTSMRLAELQAALDGLRRADPQLHHEAAQATPRGSGCGVLLAMTGQLRGDWRQ